MTCRKPSLALLVFALATSFLNPASGAEFDDGRLKVFILAGQSNMEGKGSVEIGANGVSGALGSLRYEVDNDPANYGHLTNANGTWASRDDVWIYSTTDDGEKGNLTVGYGSSAAIGPELGFGNVVGDLHNDQVLLIKTCWGGKSLAVDFRPPSSGGTTGFYYNETLDVVNSVLGNLSTHFPGYADEGYDIVGFGWHQGWNDRVNESHVAEYEVNMANFIRDIRDDLGTPNLPFVLAETGMGGEGETNARALALMDAQAAMADPVKYPEFDGNVGFVRAREFWRDASVSPSSQGYHWNSNGETYHLIGDGMGDAISPLVVSSLALSYTWDGSVGVSWHDVAVGTSHWIGGEPDGIPTGENPTFVNAGSVLVDADAIARSVNVTGGAVRILAPATLTTEYEVQVGAGGTVSIDAGGRLAATKQVYVDAGGTLTVNGELTALSMDVRGNTAFGVQSVATVGPGRMDFTEGALTSAGTLTTADLHINGATRPQLVLSGGTLSTANAIIGSSEQGTLAQAGGLHTITGDVTLGQARAADGTYTLTDGELRVDGELIVGSDGSGTFEQTGGSAHGGVGMALGLARYSEGHYTLHTGAVVSGTTRVGVSGTGEFAQNGGTHDADNMTLGEAYRSDGTYTLTDGELRVSDELIIGSAGAGTFEQTGGSAHGGLCMTLGLKSTATGRYTLRGGELVNTATHVGAGGVGEFIQNGGTHHAGTLKLGAGYKHGTYTLTDGTLRSTTTTVGADGDGQFTQSGGTHTSDATHVRDGTYALTAGRHETDALHVGDGAVYNLGAGMTTTVELVGTKTINGTTYNVYDVVAITNSDWTNAKLVTELTAGSLYQSPLGNDVEPNPAIVAVYPDLEWDTYVTVPGGYPRSAGFAGETTINTEVIDASWFDSADTGPGTFVVARLTLSDDAAGIITGRNYNVPTQGEGVEFTWQIGDQSQPTGGTLAAADQYVGSGGPGRFAHCSGTNIAGTLSLGFDAGSTGVYDMVAGTLVAENIHVGVAGRGELSIAGPYAEVTVSGRLRFGSDSALTARPGATVRLAGGDLEIAGTDPAALAGLSELALIIDSGTAASLLEVAGADLGAVPAGWDSNFALGALRIGGDQPGRLELADLTDNQPGAAGTEALYVTELAIDDGSTLLLNGLHLYFLNGGDAKLLLPGDATLDGFVDDCDLSLLLANWGKTTGWSRGELSGVGPVDDNDLSLLLANWTGAAPAPMAVPEPASLALLAIGGAALLRRRRR